MPAFPLRRVVGAAALGGPEIPHDQQQSQIVLLAPHQAGTKQYRRCSHATRSSDCLWAASRGCRLQPEGLSSPFVPGTFWTRGRTNVAGISRFGEAAWRHGRYGFQTCALCHQVSHWELFANIPSLPFILLTVFFQSLPNIHKHR